MHIYIKHVNLHILQISLHTPAPDQYFRGFHNFLFVKQIPVITLIIFSSHLFKTEKIVPYFRKAKRENRKCL